MKIRAAFGDQEGKVDRMEEEPIGSPPISLIRLFPPLRLIRCVGVALDGRSMLLASVGLLAMWLGWSGLDGLFAEARYGPMVVPAPGPIEWNQGLRPDEPFALIVSPFRRIFAMEAGIFSFWHAILAAVWCAIVWGIVGGAIARVAALRLTRGERVGILSALRFALARAVALIGAPLSPLIGVAFFAALCGLMGLLYRIPGPIGASLAGVFAFLPLLAGLVMALIVAGLAVGWPLMTATVSVEAEDAFDALSRAYSYVYQRPSRYALYVLIASAAGWVGGMVVWAFAALVLHMAQWGLSFGAPMDLVMSLYNGKDPALPIPSSIHWFWISTVRWIARAWTYSYFWTAATMIYLLLRHDVDGASFYDVAEADEADESFVPAPPEAAKKVEVAAAELS